MFVWGVAAGLPLSLAGALLEGHTMVVPGPLGLLETTVKSVAGPTLSLGYGAGIGLLFQRLPGLMRAFAPAGQLALTNYLLQSIAGIVVFYGIGFALMGRVPLVAALAGAAAFFGSRCSPVTRG